MPSNDEIINPALGLFTLERTLDVTADTISRPLPNDHVLLRTILSETRTFCRYAERFDDAHQQLVAVLPERERLKPCRVVMRDVAKIPERLEDSRLEPMPNLSTPILRLLACSEHELALLLRGILVSIAAPGHSELDPPIDAQALGQSALVTAIFRRISWLCEELHQRASKKLSSLDELDAHSRDIVHQLAMPLRRNEQYLIEAKTATPSWDDKSRTLTYQGQICKRFARVATRQFELLNEFENQGWPTRLPHNPFVNRNISNHEILKQTIKDLDKQLKVSSRIGVRYREDKAEWYPRETMGNSPNSH